MAQRGEVVIIGAGGNTGGHCVRQALKAGYGVRAGGRSATLPQSLAELSDNPQLSAVASDVRDLASLESAFRGAKWVIFAASASRKPDQKESNTSHAIDFEGLKNVARACVAEGSSVQRLVVISSACVTKPDSAIYNIINYFATDVMDNKLRGEEGLKAVFAEKPQAACDYTIVRPGGLTDAAAQGVEAMRVSTGDKLSGRISREDVAAICVAALEDAQVRNVTFECFAKGSEAMLGVMGYTSLILLYSTGYRWVPLELPENFDKDPATYEELFSGLASAADGARPES